MPSIAILRLRYSRVVRIILLFFIVGLLFRYLFTHREIFETLAKLQMVDLILLAFCWILLYIGSGLRIDLLARVFGAKMKLYESIVLNAACSTLSFFFPLRAGLGLRATYLLKKYKVTLGTFAAIMFGAFALSFAVEGLEGLLVCTYLSITGRLVSRYLYGGFLVMTIGAAFAWLIPLDPKWIRKRLGRHLTIFESSRNAMKKDVAKVVWVIFINVLTSFVYGVWLWLGYNSMSLTISFWGAFIIGLATTLSIIVTITPGNIGFQEAIIGSVSTLVGSSFEHGFTVSILLRGVSVLMLGVAGFPSLWYISSYLSKNSQ